MNKKEKIVLIGGGKHAGVVIDLIETSSNYEIVGIVDPLLKVTDKFFSINVLGDDEALKGLIENGVKVAALGVGSRGDNMLRHNLYKKAKSLGFVFPVLIHSHAFVSKYAHLSEGVQVMAGACIQTGAVVGENTVINTGAIIEHDCSIGQSVYTGPRCVISGNVTVQELAFIGSGSCIIPDINIGLRTLIAAGAVVVKDISDNEKVKGVPAEKF